MKLKMASRRARFAATDETQLINWEIRNGHHGVRSFDQCSFFNFNDGTIFCGPIHATCSFRDYMQRPFETNYPTLTWAVLTIFIRCRLSISFRLNWSHVPSDRNQSLSLTQIANEVFFCLFIQSKWLRTNPNCLIYLKDASRKQSNSNFVSRHIFHFGQFSERKLVHIHITLRWRWGEDKSECTIQMELHNSITWRFLLFPQNVQRMENVRTHAPIVSIFSCSGSWVLRVCNKLNLKHQQNRNM